jgi:surface polysaccharide O-acyltransferase-like enzyme
MDGTSGTLTQPGVLAAQPIKAVVSIGIQKAARLANVERLRVFAMLEIVCFHDHADRLPWVGGLGLPTFLLLTNLFNTTLTQKRGVAKFLEDKRERLFMPWLFWSAVYLVLAIQSAFRHGVPLHDALSWMMILAGTSSHLWFVPFALFSAGLVAGVQYSTRHLPDRPVAYSALGAGVAVLACCAVLADRPFEAPIPQWIIAISSAFFGLGLGRLVLAEGALKFRHVWPLALVALAGALAGQLYFHSFLVWRYAVSLLLVLAMLLRPGKAEPISKFLSPLLFGIYLAHHLLAERVLSHVPLIAHSQFLFVIDFVLTALIVRGLKETPLRRFV